MQKYINLNAQYGLDKNCAFRYKTIVDIMANMDRLGIWQTVVEFPGGNTLARAKQLLQDIAQYPQHRQRIIPSFILDPTILAETDGIPQFIQILKDNQPCCLTLRPKSSKFLLRMADLILDEIWESCSVILMDYDQLAPEQAAYDLVYLAQRYPQLSFVVRQPAWTGYAFLFDVMSRAKNIYVDNSRLHTRRAVELFTNKFGPERVLFSTEQRSTGGAAMAAITFSGLTEEEKDNIRFGNFVRLFREEKSRKMLMENAKVIPNQVKNSFWTPFVEQGILPNVDIHDIHCHLGVPGNGWYLAAANLETQTLAFEEDMDTYHIQHVVTSVNGRPDVLEANQDMRQAVQGRSRFRGYVRYNPNFGEEYTDEYLDAYFADPYFVGLKTLPSYMGVDIRDPRYDRMFRYANEHGLPVLIHCSVGGNAFGDPVKCAEAAAKWPNAKVVLGHSGSGGNGRLLCEAIAQDPQYNNVYFEFCGSFTSTRCWEDTLKHIDYRRVLYGTDACLHDMGWEMGRLLSCDIPEEQLTAILGGNAKKIYRF